MVNSFSIICPVYNEEHYINGIIDFFLNLNYEHKELIIVDGGSSDDTRAIVKSRMTSDNKIKLINNPFKTVPFALNLGIKNSKGDIIIRMDAHTEYADNYVERIISTFENYDADIVGGPTRIATGSYFQNCVGSAISNPFGIGNSKVHDYNFRGYTDHVTFGAWKREIFDQVGLFDEKLVRNQDDEFHYRAKSKGKKIYQNPEIKLWYYPRKNIIDLFKQYFQYGLYKPMVLLKIKSEIKLRHLVPSVFFVYLLFLTLNIYYPLIIIPLCIYMLLITGLVFLSGRKSRVELALYLIYPIIHISYGSGFITGIVKIIYHWIVTPRG